MSEPYRREASITGEYRLEIEDLAGAMAVHPTTRRWKHAWVVGVPLLVLALGVGAWAGISVSAGHLVLGGILTAASAMIAISPRAQIAKKTEAQRALRVTVREHGYRVESTAGEAHERVWANVRRAVIGPGAVFLLLPQHADILPRRAFSEQALAEVLATLERNRVSVSRSRRSRAPVLGLVFLLLVVGMNVLYRVVRDRPGTVVPVGCELELELAHEEGEVVAWARLWNTSGGVAYGVVDAIRIEIFRDGERQPIEWVAPDAYANRPLPLSTGMRSHARDASFYPGAPGRYRVRAEQVVSAPELDAIAIGAREPFRVCIPRGPVEAVIDVP